MSKITIKGICPRCQRDWEVTVDEANYQSFKEGDMLAQQAFPELSPAERELLITSSQTKKKRTLVQILILTNIVLTILKTY